MKAIVWSKPACPFCTKAKNLLKNKGIEYEEKNIAEGYKIQDLLEMVPNARTMPHLPLGILCVLPFHSLPSLV